ncbi:hypothetical protein P4S64_18035 [Vibrio sp. M60_M31a]
MAHKVKANVSGSASKEQLSNVNLLDQLTCPIGESRHHGQITNGSGGLSISPIDGTESLQHQANKQHNEMQPDVKQQNEEQWQQANLARKNTQGKSSMSTVNLALSLSDEQLKEFAPANVGSKK